MPDKSQFPDAELITRCLENDAEAWETLVRRYQRLISSIAFRFGLTADEVFALQAHGYNPMGIYVGNESLRQAIDLIASGLFTGGDRTVVKPVVDSLVYRDPFMLLADYQPYIDIEDKALAAYGDTEAWTRMSILNTARSGYFTSDRTIREYASGIWKVQPVPVPRV